MLGPLLSLLLPSLLLPSLLLLLLLLLPLPSVVVVVLVVVWSKRSRSSEDAGDAFEGTGDVDALVPAFGAAFVLAVVA